jgi:flagellar biosynthetic protein FliR
VTVSFPLDHATAFALAGVRLLALFLSGPVFGHALVPVRVRVGLAFAVAWASAPSLAGALPPPETLPLALAVLQEALVGALLGFATSLVFSGLALLGEFASIQGGLGAAAVLDPTSGASSIVLSSVVQVFATLLFLGMDGHHLVLRAVRLSFEHFPPGAAALPLANLAAVAELGAVVFEVAVRLAAPVTAVMLVSNLAVGILGRVIPQLNLVALQLPGHVGVTLLVLGLGAGPLTDALADTLQRVTERAVAAAVGGG